jgi:hypothetical protein
MAENELQPCPRCGGSGLLTLIVADEADAWIINRAKEAIGQGDEEAARAILKEITDERRTEH